MGGARRQLVVLAAVVIALAAVTAVVWASDGGDSPAAPVAASAPLGALDGADVFQAKGCATCHMGPGTESSFGIGPSLVALPGTAGSRIPGLGAEEYVRESILDPGAFVAAPAGQSGVTMPRLDVSPAELDALVGYLLPPQDRQRPPRCRTQERCCAARVSELRAAGGRARRVVGAGCSG